MGWTSEQLDVTVDRAFRRKYGNGSSTTDKVLGE